MSKWYHIRDQKTHEVIETVECKATGTNIERWEDGFFAKVDFERFYLTTTWVPQPDPVVFCNHCKRRVEMASIRHKEELVLWQGLCHCQANQGIVNIYSVPVMPTNFITFKFTLDEDKDDDS